MADLFPGIAVRMAKAARVQGGKDGKGGQDGNGGKGGKGGKGDKGAVARGILYGSGLRRPSVAPFES